MKLTPREAKSQRIEQSAELAHEYLIRCLTCYRTSITGENGIDQQACHDDRCTKMLCSKCPQFVCSHCGLAHCSDHKIEYSGLELCPICFRGAQVDATEAEQAPAWYGIRLAVERYAHGELKSTEYAESVRVTQTYGDDSLRTRVINSHSFRSGHDCDNAFGGLIYDAAPVVSIGVSIPEGGTLELRAE